MPRAKKRVERRFTKKNGSVAWKAGYTRMLCAASLRRVFNVPRKAETLFVIASTEPDPEAVKVEGLTGSESSMFGTFKVKIDKSKTGSRRRTFPLYPDFHAWLVDNLDAGRVYYTVEYEETA